MFENIASEDKNYIGYIIDKSQKDKKIFEKLKITNQKTIWLGLITIYEVEVREKELDKVIKQLQRNMSDHIGLKKQEFYLHFYNHDELIVVYRFKKFTATSDKFTWQEAQNYGRSLGIADKQLDFLTPEDAYRRYFSK